MDESSPLSSEHRQRRSSGDGRALPEAHALRQVAPIVGQGLGWSRYAGMHGAILAMNTFGASAPLKVLQQQFGFTREDVVEAAKAQLALAKKATA